MNRRELSGSRQRLPSETRLSGWGRGIVRNHPWFRPFGRTSCDQIRSRRICRTPPPLAAAVLHLPHRTQNTKKPPRGWLFCVWLGERDYRLHPVAGPSGSLRCAQSRSNLFPTNLSNPIASRLGSSSLDPGQNKRPPGRRPLILAGGEGFEPPLAESESAVLPLDDPPVVCTPVV